MTSSNFPRYWPFVRGIHQSPVNSPHKGQWRGGLMCPLICTRIHGWVNNGEAGDMRRYRAHYDVTVMCNASWAHVTCRISHHFSKAIIDPLGQPPCYARKLYWNLRFPDIKGWERNHEYFTFIRGKHHQSSSSDTDFLVHDGWAWSKLNMHAHSAPIIAISVTKIVKLSKCGETSRDHSVFFHCFLTILFNQRRIMRNHW